MSKAYSVTLTAHGNIDRGQDPYELLFPAEVAVADTIEECQQIVRSFIEETGIGGGNWTGGRVIDRRTGECVGHISYNSRFWPEETK